MSAYYNENDKFAAAWLRELIKTGLIAAGEVDERSIEEVKPDDLRGFTQCHFFAGIGVWSYALRNAGWSDDSPVWTGSCPCQGFSSSGQRGGFSDKRHLWPAWFRLIRESRPVVCFGEQVASQDGLAWLDVVSSDLENQGYAVGATDLCAAGLGAPHIRQRLYFVANAGYRHERIGAKPSRNGYALKDAWRSEIGALAQPEGRGHPKREYRDETRAERQAPSGRQDEGRWRNDSPDGGNAGNLGHANGEGPQGHGRLIEQHGTQGRQGKKRHSRTAGFWADAEWVYCRDEKYRPVEPGTFPLVNGATNRVGRLRGYGNAINAQVAKAFIEAYREIV